MRLSRSHFRSSAISAAIVAISSLLVGKSLVFAAIGPSGASSSSQYVPPANPQAAPAGQAPAAPPAGTPGPPHDMPAPINLKVLPRNLTGQQVHEIMHKWSAELGTGCKSCHAVDPGKTGPDGKPALNYADDSKEEKKTARVMYTMTENINVNYVAKIDNSGEPVSCGTCHRGHFGPEPYVPPVHPH